MVESLEGQIKVMDQLLMWNNELNPQKFLGKEYKILLLWFKIVQIFWNYLKVNPTDKNKVIEFKSCWQCLTTFRLGYLSSLQITRSNMEKTKNLVDY